MVSFKHQVNPKEEKVSEDIQEQEPENIEPIEADDLQDEQPKKRKRKKTKKVKDDSIEYLSDFSAIVQLPFLTVLKPPLTPEETATLSTALMRWVDKRFNSIMEYSVDVALATALITIILPRTNILKLNAKSSNNDNREERERENNTNEKIDVYRMPTQKSSGI